MYFKKKKKKENVLLLIEIRTEGGDTPSYFENHKGLKVEIK